jgi:hypothetical protein
MGVPSCRGPWAREGSENRRRAAHQRLKPGRWRWWWSRTIARGVWRGRRGGCAFAHKGCGNEIRRMRVGRVIDAVTLARATQRDPELATKPAKSAMRTRSEREDACIFVIKLAR